MTDRGKKPVNPATLNAMLKKVISLLTRAEYEALVAQATNINADEYNAIVDDLIHGIFNDPKAYERLIDEACDRLTDEELAWTKRKLDKATEEHIDAIIDERINALITQTFDKKLLLLAGAYLQSTNNTKH